MNISGFINRDVHPQNFHLSISIVKKHTFYCVSNKLLYFCKRKELFDSKHMHNAEIRTVAKLLPLLRKNTHKSLILSYSEYLGRIFLKKHVLHTYTQKCNFLAIHLRNTLLCQRLFLFKLYFCSRKINEASKTVAI